MAQIQSNFEKHLKAVAPIKRVIPVMGKEVANFAQHEGKTMLDICVDMRAKDVKRVIRENKKTGDTYPALMIVTKDVDYLVDLSRRVQEDDELTNTPNKILRLVSYINDHPEREGEKVFRFGKLAEPLYEDEGSIFEEVEDDIEVKD